MVKKQIKEFELKTEGGSYPCTLPCKVGRVLSQAGASTSELGEYISFDGVISADEIALSIKYFYLRIHCCSLCWSTSFHTILGYRKSSTIACWATWAKQEARFR